MPEVRKLWATEGLFSDHYLKARIKSNDWWPSDTEAQPVFQFCKELYEKRAFALRRYDNEMGVRQEFIDKILERLATPEVSKLAQASVGLNFGSQKLPPGFTTWAKDKPVPFLLRPLAAEIFAFDVLTQNPDRRQVNPNLLTNGEELYLCDHEQAFSFLAGVIGWQPPWKGQGLDFFRNHVFFQQLQGGEHKWERLLGALEALTDTRLKEYLAAVPNEWRSNNAAADRISEYLQDARENRDPLFAVINRLLK
jgi:hypothetical protein